MYYQKRRSSALLRKVVAICLILGVFWIVKNPGAISGVVSDVEFGGGEVLGVVFEKLGDTAREQVKRVGEKGSNFQFSIFNFQLKRKEKEQKVSFRFAIVADSHEDEVYFPQILQRIKKENVDFLIHLGDLVNSGDLEKIRQGKDFLDNSGVPYYIIPGDHDYNWQPEHSLANFKEVFGNEQIYPPNRRVYSSFGHKGFFFILFDNSDNTNEVDVTQLKWLKDELEEHATNYQPSTTNKFVFCHKPLLNPYFPDKVDPNGTAVLELLTDYKVTQVFSGNVHTFARYPDSQTGIGITTIGAAGTYKNPLPQYALVTVFEDGSFNVEAKPYKEIRLGE